MKKFLTILPLLFVGLFLSAQSDAEYNKMLPGTWELVSVDMGGQVMTADMLPQKVVTVFNADGTVVADNPISGTKEKANWQIKNGVIVDPNKETTPKSKIISMDEQSMVLEINEGGMVIKATMKKTK